MFELRVSCSAINHPSGQLRRSEEDIKLTRKLVDGSAAGHHGSG
ncbi:MAG: hypothetical protein IPP83_15885 [Flavobacteriales bacterium]|nr:hypothetical protein [Flavobacteriales bacterium]